MIEPIAPDKSGYPQDIFLISPRKIHCGYSLDVFGRNKNIINTFFGEKSALNLEL